MLTIEKLSQKLTVPSPENKTDYDLEMGLLLYNSGNFRKSLPYLKKAVEFFLESKNFPDYFIHYPLLFHSLNELGEKETAKQLYEDFKKVCNINKIPETPIMLATSAYCNIIVEENFDTAKKELDTALKLAFEKYDEDMKKDDRYRQNNTKFHIIHCLYIYSIYYFTVKDYENCRQELQNLKILLRDYLNLKKEVELDHSRTNNAQKLTTYHRILEGLKKNFPHIQRLKLGLKFIEAHIEINHVKNYKSAEKLLWELYEEANKINCTLYTPYILCSMAVCYIGLKNKKQAQMFFNLAKKHSKKERKLLLDYMDHLNQTEKLDQIEESDNYDLIFDTKDHLIVEKQKGYVDLKNQFILIELLKLFLLNPGVSYSKEKIIQTIWKQDYIPEVHDNKIYVTIKRLREMIETNSCKPNYIRRNNAGYHFSEQAKVLVKQ